METGTPPVKQYLLGARYQYAGKTAQYQAQEVIQNAINKIKSQHTWKRRQDRQPYRPQKFQDLKEYNQLLHIIAQQEREQECPDRKGKKKQSNAEQMASILWKDDWQRHPMRRGTPKGLQEFGKYNYRLYMDLRRAEASIVSQIRSEHIGFRAYLHRRKVPGIQDTECPCGYHVQNPEHMVLVCPKWAEGRGN